MITMAKHFISKKDLKGLKQKVQSLGLDPEGLENVEIEEIKDEKCFFVNRKPFIYQKGEDIIPILFFLNTARPESKYINVDDGAVPHIMNGANVFAQGITGLDPGIAEGDMVFIRNKDGVYIAVGISTRSAQEIMGDHKGEAVRLLHFPDDRIFKTFYE